MAQHSTNDYVKFLEPKVVSSSDIWKLLTLALGFVMATLDATVVNVAGASIQQKLNMNVSELTWVIDGYVLTFASLLLVAGTLANRFGAKTTYLSGMMIFIISSFLCAISQNGIILVTGRLIQGAGAALFMPSSLSLLANAYSDEQKRAKMIGLWSSIVAAASGFGPFIGGILVQTFGWQSIFLINLPIGILGFILTFKLIAQPPVIESRLNILSHIYLFISLASLSFGLIEGTTYGWTSIPILISLFMVCISTILFIIRESRNSSPIIPAELIRKSQYTSANLIGFLLNFSLFGSIFMFGLFLQKERGASSFLAGLELLPIMIVFVLGNLLFTKFVGIFGTRRPMIVSLILASVCSFLMMYISPETSYLQIAIIFALSNLGVGVTVPAMTTTLIQAAEKTHANIASASLNANRQIGALVGIAVVGVVLHFSENWYRVASMTYLISGIAYIFAAIIVLFFIRKD